MSITEYYMQYLFDTEKKAEIMNTVQTKIVSSVDINISQLSPTTQIILQHLSPESKQRMYADIMKDNIYIQKTELKEEDSDPSYTYFENKEVGTFMELWICANILCPGCQEGKLLKYLNPNMPVIDVVCSNENHTVLHGPKYYQIKTSEAYTQFMGMKYFDFHNRHIHVGSPKYGHVCHNVKLGDSMNKKNILIGYICIVYKKKLDRIISIDLNNSFIVIPRLNIIATNDNFNLQYYTYLDTRLPSITFNDNLCVTYMLNLYTEKTMFKNINLDTVYDIIQYVPKSVRKSLF